MYLVYQLSDIYVYTVTLINQPEKNRYYSPFLPKKWAKILSRHFTKEDMEMVNKHIKFYSTSLVMR